MATIAAVPATGTLINTTTEGGIAWIEMNDPPANTYTYEMMQQLDGAILRARMDGDVHIIIVRGAGDKFFSAGANIKIIAALNGHTVGGGLEIALAADIRLARQDAGKIGLPEVALGVLPGTGGTQRLSRLVGKSRSIELMATGRTFSFEEAEEMGLVNQVFARDTFFEEVTEYARQFLPPRKAARAVGRIKRSVQSGLEMSFAEGLSLERELQQHLFQSEDAHEGLAAYVEKRTPNFKAR